MSDQQPKISKAFQIFMSEAPQHAQAWGAAVQGFASASALNKKTAALAYLAVLAALLAPFVIVRRHEARLVGAVQRRIEDDHGNAAADGIGHLPFQRLVVQGGQHDPVHAAGDEVFHHLHLGFEVVFLDAPLPDDLDVAQLPLGLLCAVVHRLPEQVAGPLGDDGDGELLLA